MKKILSIIAIIAICSPFIAQTVDLGNPISWNSKIPKMSEKVILPGFDLALTQFEDSINDANKIGPWKFGHEYEVDLGLENSGEWYRLPNGDRIWRLELIAPGAITMNFIFDKYVLPEGAYLMLFPKDKSYHHNAYTSINNNEAQVLGTALIKGDDVVIEYYEPAEVVGQGQLHLLTTVHGYRSVSFFADEMGKALNSSGACNIDVLCPLGVGWESEVSSVAMIVSGGGLCTGALVNNTANDGTPYFLTANHCGHNASWSFQFNWVSPSPSCATTANSTNGSYDEINGSQLRASNSGSDFALFELNSTPPASYGLVYAGWDNSDATTVTEATGIHHPSGDIMKICREDDAPFHNTAAGAQVWYINQWEEGVTEPGSSGSPLFDQNHRIIGQLYGGAAACSGTSNNGQYDYYGRFGVSWDGSSSSNRLRDWLDPSGSGASTDDGYDPNGTTGTADDAGITTVGSPNGIECGTTISPEITLRNYGINTLSSVDILYNIDGGANSTYNWSGSLAPGAMTTVTLPTITLSSGSHTLNVATNNPNATADSDPSNDNGSSTFILGNIPLELTLELDCWGSEVSWYVTEQTTGDTYVSGGPYSDVTGGDTEMANFCLPDGCYTFHIDDSYGDGLNGTAFGCAVDGNYSLEDQNTTNIVVAMGPDPDYGDGATHDFCVGTFDVAVYNPLSDVGMYPNPTNGVMHVFIPGNLKGIELTIRDVAGRIVQKQYVNSGVKLIDLNDKASGIYVVQLNQGEHTITKKIQKF